MTEPLPDQMTAVEISEPGAPGVLRAVRRPVPAPAAGEVLIRVIAAGVNRPDCLQRQGLYPPPPGASDLPGLEVSGTVVATGAGVDGVGTGDRICALLAGGGYAEYCTAPAEQCLAIPEGMHPIDAACVPETYFTVWTNVFERGDLKAGETLLVHGGASGIGTTAIQLGKAFGAQVLATVGNDDKAALCERLGADRAVNYRETDFAEAFGPTADGGGADVILDIVGGPYLDRNLAVLKTDGRLVIIGLLGGSKTDIKLAPLLTRRLTMTGSTLRARSPAEKGAIARALEEHVWPLLEAGTARPVVQETFPLEDAAAAHALLEANEAMGKLALLVGAARDTA